MTVLILSPCFFPENISTGKYNTVLAQRLLAGGSDVLVFASHPFYPNWRPSRSDAAVPGVVIKRGGAWVRYPRAVALRRAVLEAWFALFCLFSYIRLRPKPRYIVAVFPPTIFMLLLKLVISRGSLVTGIVHDLQSAHIGNTLALPSRFADAIISWVERLSFASCDRLIFLSRSMAERAILRYRLDPAKCSVGYPFQTTMDSGVTTDALADVLRTEHLNVVYSGALGDKQSPDELVALMSALTRRNERVRCHIFSAGPHFDRLQARYLRESDSTIAFRALVPDEYLDELYARSTVQLIPQAAGTSEGSLPSKLPNLLAAGVPIFAICEPNSEVSRFLQETRGGVSAPSFAAAEAIPCFDALLAEEATESRVSRIARLRPFVDKNFGIERVVDTIFCAG